MEDTENVTLVVTRIETDTLELQVEEISPLVLLLIFSIHRRVFNASDKKLATT